VLGSRSEERSGMPRKGRIGRCDDVMVTFCGNISGDAQIFTVYVFTLTYEKEKRYFAT
jgi:hypothetical protein